MTIYVTKIISENNIGHLRRPNIYSLFYLFMFKYYSNQVQLQIQVTPRIITIKYIY